MVHDLLGQAYSSIKHNRRRTALTMLGMAWGIATVVLLLAYGDGFGQAITRSFQLRHQGDGRFCRAEPRCRPGRKGGVQVRITMTLCRIAGAIRGTGNIPQDASFQTNVQHGKDRVIRRTRIPPSRVPGASIKAEYGRFYNDADEMQRRTSPCWDPRRRRSFFRRPAWVSEFASPGSALK